MTTGSWQSVTSARVGPSRRDDIDKKIIRVPFELGLVDHDTYQDQSEIVHDFGDGWTIRALKTAGDFMREGEFMGNCIGQMYRDEVKGIPKCRRKHSPKSPKNKVGKCITCNDTGLDIFRPCSGCRDAYNSCTAYQCGNSKTNQGEECQRQKSGWRYDDYDRYREHKAHKLISINNPKKRFKKNEDGLCVKCNGSEMEVAIPPNDDGLEGSAFFPYEAGTDENLYDKNWKIYSLRDPNNVPKVSLNLDLTPTYKCYQHFNHFDDDDDQLRCHEHGTNCCLKCGGLDPKDYKAYGPTINEIQGKGNEAPDHKYMKYVNSFIDFARKANMPEEEVKNEEPTGPKTMQQMLEQTQKLLKRPMTPKDIEALKGILASKMADFGRGDVPETFITDHLGELATGVEPATCKVCGEAISRHAQWLPTKNVAKRTAARPTDKCKKCGSTELNRPKEYTSSGMSLCRNCGEFNEHI